MGGIGKQFEKIKILLLKGILWDKDYAGKWGEEWAA